MREYILNTNGVSECKDPYCPSPAQSAGCRAPVGEKIKKILSVISNLLLSQVVDIYKGGINKF